MPIAKTQLPNGKIARFEVKEGITPEQIELFALEQYNAGAFDNPELQEEVATPQTIEEKMEAGVPLRSFTEDIKEVYQAPVSAFKGLETGVFGLAQAIVDVYDAVQGEGPGLFSQELAKEVKRRNKKMEDKSMLQKVMYGGAQAAPYIAATAPLGGVPGLITGTVGASLGQAQDEAGIKNRLTDAAIDTGMGLATAGAVKGGIGLGKIAKDFGESAIDTTKQAIKGAKSRGRRGLENIITSLTNKSKKLYQIIDDNGAYFKPEKVQQVINKLTKTINEDKLTIPGKSNPAYKILLDFKEEFAGKKPQNMTLNKLEQYRRIFRDFYKKDIKELGGTGEAGRMGTALSKELDDVILKAEPKDLVNGEVIGNTLKEAKRTYKELTKLNYIDDAVDIGEREGADAFNRNLKNLTRTRKKQSKSPFNKKEIAAIQATVKTSGAEGLLKAISGTGIDLASPTKNAYPILATLTAGSTAGVPAALAMQGAALGAKSIRRLAQQGKIDDLVKYIRSNPQEAIKVRDSIKDKKIRQRINQAIKAIAISTPNLNN